MKSYNNFELPNFQKQIGNNLGQSMHQSVGNKPSKSFSYTTEIVGFGLA